MTISAVPSALYPAWPAPASVSAAMSLRTGGVSAAPFDSLNLRPAEYGPPGDDANAVAVNLARWRSTIGAEPVYLRQVHGAEVVRLDQPAPPGHWVADAAVTTQPGLACTVLVADCLPVLLCDRAGTAVAAAHAGWRGLAAGVLQATVQRLCQEAACQPADIMAWLGPCIGADAFEVGADVVRACGQDAVEGFDSCRFRWSPRADGASRWRADLQGLAADALMALGVEAVIAAQGCTVTDSLRFFSFRRDGLTGRMAASIWIRS